MIFFRCDHCAKDLKVKNELAGKKVACPSCGKAMVVPQLATSLSPQPSPPGRGSKLGSANLEENRTLPSRRRWALFAVPLALLVALGGLALIPGCGKTDPNQRTENKGPGNNPEPGLPPKFTNSLGMEFVLVPKGKAWLGGGGGNPGATEVQIQHHFYLEVYEVTQEEWQKVMGSNPSHFSRTGAGIDALNGIADADLQRFPVEMVSWNDCQKFVTQLNEKVKENGWMYRLPTQGEWEYACRGGPLPQKEDYGFDFYLDRPMNMLLPDRANFDLTELKRTCQVGSFTPNRLGLYDMHGNVWEWCEDTLPDPTHRLYRGGSWFHGSGFCGAANRLVAPPANRYDFLGLRLARVPVGKEGK